MLSAPVKSRPRVVKERRVSDTQISKLDDRLQRLEARVNLLFGALGVIVVLANGGLAIVIANAIK